ncbi:prolactin-inducible protein homolog isoform X2 [Bubalus bubalis]|uniref:prolactin-inducible protein homolog isoform X2 n=1 Tax=Bubalus bubalis TaxID=89462 RepID=UPI001E1B6338|nr:prolactin-inducible protein homolog isoform X2 [Bubalus bubalis]
MHSLQLLFKTSAAALLLGVCLTLQTGTAQGQIQNVISANLTTSQIDNSTGYVITLEVSNLISQCIVVKTTLEVSDMVFFLYGNFHFTSCLCGVSTRRFFWEIDAPENGIIKGKAEVVSEENICPSDVEICSLVYKVCIKREIIIRC